MMAEVAGPLPARLPEQANEGFASDKKKLEDPDEFWALGKPSTQKSWVGTKVSP